MQLPEAPVVAAALTEATGRLTTLLRSGLDPSTPTATGWNVGELACHLSHAYDRMPNLAAQEIPSFIAAVSDLAGTTVDWIAEDPERDLGVLADRIDKGLERYLKLLADSPTARCPWIVEGSEVGMAAFGCHLLNEAFVHGFDLAKATGKKLELSPEHAALIFAGFVQPVMATIDPRSLADQQTSAGLQARFGIKMRRGLGELCFRFDDGKLTMEDEPRGKVDVRLWVDPTAFLLVGWGRQGQWGAIARGKLFAYGRKPWLGLRLVNLVSLP